MKRILIICFLFPLLPLSASFMGRADFRAKVIKTFYGTKKQGPFHTRRVTIKLVKWIKGGGHLINFGRRMTNSYRTVQLRFKNRRTARNITANQIIRVRYWTVSGIIYRKGKEKGHSSHSWTYLGNSSSKKYSGNCRVSRYARGPHHKVIRTRKQFLDFIRTIPKWIISKGPRQPSNDPLLKKPAIDFSKKMIVVVIGSTPTRHKRPKISKIVRRNGKITVYYRLPYRPRREIMSWPYGIGYYLAMVVDKTTGAVKFVQK